MSEINWHMDAPVLGLMFLSVSPGISGRASTLKDGDSTENKRALAETLVVGVMGTIATKSWWPLAAPLIYLAYDSAWYTLKDRNE